MDRREFMKKTCYGAAVSAVGGSMSKAGLPVAEVTGMGSSQPRESRPARLKRGNRVSLGTFDLIPQLNRGQKWINERLIAYGTVEPPNSGSRGRTMRSACMPAEACAHHYSMTGDKQSLQALTSAVKTFRKYKDKARARRVPYEGISKPIKLDYEVRSEEKPTIEYEMISCHVGRNMRGMRACAHILEDKQLLREVADELNWWIDNPLGFNKEKHFFDARIFLDAQGNNTGSEKRYTMNMGGSLASAMWMVGDDLGDTRLKEYAQEQILEGIVPHQLDNGYFPYGLGVDYELIDGIAIESNYYHTLTLQVLSGLLAYEYWRKKDEFVHMMRHGAEYIRRLTADSGEFAHPGKVDVARMKKKNFYPKPNWGSTAGSALIHTRMYKYLGDEEAFEQASRNLRWLHWNCPACIPFLPTDPHLGMQHIVTEWGVSHSFRQIVLAAREGMHLKRKGLRDVEAVFAG